MSGRGWRMVGRSSQANRAPMLLFELDGALFQLEAREPALEPLSQLPLSQSSLCRLRALDPGAQHLADLSEVNRSGLVLMLRYELSTRRGEEPQIEAQ